MNETVSDGCLAMGEDITEKISHFQGRIESTTSIPLIGHCDHWVTRTSSLIECVCSCDQKLYLHNETKGGICMKIEFNPQKNISLLQDGRRFFVYSSNRAAVTSCEHTLYHPPMKAFNTIASIFHACERNWFQSKHIAQKEKEKWTQAFAPHQNQVSHQNAH